jgi:hypothetical protein
MGNKKIAIYAIYIDEIIKFQLDEWEMHLPIQFIHPHLYFSLSFSRLILLYQISLGMCYVIWKSRIIFIEIFTYKKLLSFLLRFKIFHFYLISGPISAHELTFFIESIIHGIICWIMNLGFSYRQYTNPWLLVKLN